jgi:hypothetical protein
VLRNPIPKGMGKHRQGREVQVMSEPRIKCLACKERKTFDQIGEGLVCVECQEAK